MKVTYLERSPGSWRLRVEIRDASGQRRFRYETLRGTRQDAEARAVELRRECSPEHLPIGSTTLAEFAQGWISRRGALQEISEGSVGVYKGLVALVPDDVAGKRLRSLTGPEVQQAYIGLLQAGYSATTVRGLDRLLRRILDDATREGALSKNPLADVVAPGKPRGKLTTISKPKLRALLDTLKTNDVLGYVVRFAIATGCRRGEICGLKWEDVDLNAGTATIRRNLIWSDSKRDFVERPLKTEASYRVIVLPEETLAELRARYETRLTEYVFETRDGHRRSPNALSAQVSKMLAAHGLGDFSLHDLRHAHATMLLGERFNPKAVARRMGHADVTTTLRIYSHVMPGDDDALAQHMGKFFD